MSEAKAEEQFRQNRMAVLARSGDCDAYARLLLELLPMIRRKAARYSAYGLEKDDLAQEGAIGLMKAVTRYDFSSGVPFAAFAALCADRQMISAARASSRRKNTPEQPTVSISELEEQVPSLLSTENPEERLLMKEKLRTVFDEVDTQLSPLEKKVLAAYLDSVSYGKTAARLGLSEKSVDNAMQRIRRKLRRPDTAP